MKDEVFSEYDYTLPEDLIAHEPAPVRDQARLFVYDTHTDTVTFDIFANIANYLPKNAVMILNDTKVEPARITGRVAPTQKNTTTRTVELLCLINEPAPSSGTIYAISKNKMRAGTVVTLEDGHTLRIVRKENDKYVIEPQGNMDLYAYLRTRGFMPLPRYIKTNLPSHAVHERYQTIFAEHSGSVAAPTASLHFTNNVFASLDQKSIQRYCATLHVGMGTFAVVHEKQLATNTLHTEWYAIPRDTVAAVQDAKMRKNPVIAVGTTITRTLESAHDAIVHAPNPAADISGSTQLFIRPGYQFTIVDHLITNFHVPRSSLISLVDAFLVHKGSKRRVISLYKAAIDAKMRFYSFGDSMLIL